jgi:flagellar hook-associated protein 2
MITTTIEAASKPKTQWQTRIDTLEVKKTLYQELQSQFIRLRNKLTSLKLESAYKGKKAEFTVYSPSGANADSIVTATVGNDAVFTSWEIDVKSLARAQRHVSARFDDAGASLGISGSFRIHVGNSYATIDISSADSLREINQKIGQATDQYGNKMNVTAKLLDNRLVIESLIKGVSNNGVKMGESLVMFEDGTNEMYLPRSSVRDENTGKYVYPPQILELTYEDTNVDGTKYIYQYKYGTDFTYDSDLGKITWLTGPGTRRPPEGASFNVIYSRDNLTGTRTSAQKDAAIPESAYWDELLLISSGVPYDDSSNLRVFANGKEYVQGTDFDVITHTDGKQYIRWGMGTTPPPVAPDDMPANGSYILQIGGDAVYSTNESVLYIEPVDSNWQVARDSTTETVSGNAASLNWDILPPSPSGAPYDANSNLRIFANGVEYVRGVDFQVITHNGNQYIEWITGTGSTPANGSYTLQIGGDYTSNSILAQLGFITPGNTNDDWVFTEGSYTNAEDATLYVDGVKMTRPSNTIDDVIANVTLELKGIGEVKMNITQDVTTTIEDLESFVEEYNAVMEWINYYVSQKEDAANQVSEDDHLSSILAESKGNTVFGVLHGDQLLWSIKNQLRSKVAMPQPILPGAIASRKFQHPSAELNVKGSFYLYVGGKATRIDVTKNDSLEDIQRKLEESTNIFAPTAAGTPLGASMGLSVSINNGQLIIGSSGTASFDASGQVTLDTRNGSIKKSSDNFELLDFLPVMESPISGSLTISTGSYQYDSNGNVIQEPTIYRDGIDYKVITETNANGALQSRIEWLQGGKSPVPNTNYDFSYSYKADSVMISEIQGSGDLLGETNDLSWLNFHPDSGKAMLANLGFTTESTDNGKSGYLEFDSDKFFEQVQADPNVVANVMQSFMRDMDSYIGNLVDSSQIMVGGQTITKGRIAGALSSIDVEQATLYERISKLDKELEAKQTSLYKQYSDMEVAIQKLNAQMSAITNFISSTSSTSTSS